MSRHALRARLALLVLPALASCAPDPLTATVAQPTVYGTDDRQDLYACADPGFAALAQHSAVALIPRGAVDLSDPAHVAINAPTLGAEQNLCSDQRFLDDPAAGLCSGTLIDDDLVLTAGHCVVNMTFCSTLYFVFGFDRPADGQLGAITADDVYTCAGIVTRAQSMAGGQYIDYAVVRLARAATPSHTPATVYTGRDPMAAGQRVTCVGFPNGIPVKIDSGGAVRDPRASTGDYFVATTDTFEGNSGSGVYDTATHELRGILLDGDEDYVARGGCNVVHQCGETECTGESVGYVTHALDALCAATHSARLCAGREDAGVGTDAGQDAGADAGTDASADAGDDAGASGDAGADAREGADGSDMPGRAAGCGCAVPARGASRGALTGLALAGALGLLRARRGRRAGR